VVKEGEVTPFSILDNMPIERPVCSESSLTVIFLLLRKSRTSLPIAASRLRSLSTLTLWGSCEGNDLSLLGLGLVEFINVNRQSLARSLSINPTPYRDSIGGKCPKVKQSFASLARRQKTAGTEGCGQRDRLPHFCQGLRISSDPSLTTQKINQQPDTFLTVYFFDICQKFSKRPV